MIKSGWDTYKVNVNEYPAQMILSLFLGIMSEFA